MQRWMLIAILCIASADLGACSNPSGPEMPSSIGRALERRTSGTRSFQVLHTFENGRDGAEPDGGLLLVNGTAYGTTPSGGTGRYGLDDASASNPAGTIYKIDASGHYSVVYRFAPHVPPGQRAYPDAGLVTDAAGNFYGTTNEGGPSAKGTVYKLDAHGRVTTLHTFTGYSDGEYPYAGLVRDAAGNLYGTTKAGGNANCSGAGCGTVFKIDAKHRESVLYAFGGNPSDGCVPYGGVVPDRHGNLYGTTDECGGCPMAYVCGIAYKIDPYGHETVLYKFVNQAGGEGPYDALLLGSNHDLYGTTNVGGMAKDGLVFKMDKRGNETVLYNFTGGSDGAYPFGGVIQDAASNLYGTTEFGGGYGCASGIGCGTVFELDASGKETVLYRFTGKKDGMFPLAGLAMDAKTGYLYGTTQLGGDKECNNGLGCGVAFKLKP